MLEVRVLGNQPEPTLVNEGMSIIDFEVRTRDEEIFEQGKLLIDQYVDQNPELEGCQLIINDPMTVGLYYQTEQEHQYDNIHVTSMNGTDATLTSAAVTIKCNGDGVKTGQKGV